VVQARIVQLQQERAAQNARARVEHEGRRAVNTKLKVMPEQEPKQTPDQSLPATPEAPRPQAAGGPSDADSELPEGLPASDWAGQPLEEIPEGQVFVADDDFYKSLEQTAKPPAIPDTPGKRLKVRIPRLRLSTAQKILVAGIVLIVALLLRTLLTSSSRSAAASSKSSADSAIPADQKQPPRYDATSHLGLPAEEPGPAPQSAQPTSLKVAQDFYAAGEYDNAYATYNQLYRSLPPDANSHRDLLRLKMALCRAKSGQIEEADSLLDEVAKSSSNALSLMANYHRISLEMQKKQYLNARTRAYRAMALIDVVDTDAKIKTSLRSNCHFLIAEALTKHVLSLSDLDADLTPELWGAPAEIDPFLGLDDQQLEALLNSGADYLNDALLRPQIREIHRDDGSTCWSVVANGAPIEELLARFAANADLDISWTLGSAQDPQAQGPSVRSPGTGRPQPDKRDVGGSADPAHNRPVILYMPAATAQQVVAAAAGQVGLVARIDQNDVITIIQPVDSSSFSQSISLLCSETISLWQRFLLSFDADRRAANAHFALGLLHSRQGDIPEAIAEYKLTANRFPSSSLAPYALLNSSKLKSSPQVRDYAGAAEDLKQVVEQYPDDRIVTRAYAHLAEYTENAGTIGEAARLYRKVYYLGFSPESQCSAAFGAGKCYYQIGDYDSAVEWLANYIDLMGEKKNPDVCSACFLLGKAYLNLNEPQQACRAFQYALAGPLPKNEYVETISALTDAYIAQKQFLQALDVLENVDSYQFSQAELVRILLLRSKVLREMGLVDNAVTLLSSRIEYASDPGLKAEISFELTNCYIARNQLDLAHKKLTEILLIVPPGPLAYEVSFKLAQTCLMLNQDSQAISVCSQLLDSAAPEQIRTEAAQMLATAYSRQKNYDKAALALLDRPK
jgi:tetratricopeptide (TPR) repeat protein